MATYDGAYNGSQPTNGHILRLEVLEIARDVANDKTTQRCNLYMIVNNSSYGYFNQSGSSTASINCNGNSTGNRRADFDARSTGTKTLISSWDTIVEHADGTKIINIQVNHTSGVGLGNASININHTIDTIPRASQPTMSNFNVGNPAPNNVVINMNRLSNAFTHTVKVQFGSWSKTLATGVTDNYPWNVATDQANMLAQIPNSRTGTGTVTVDTYNGSTLIGTKSVDFVATVVNSNPVFSNFSFLDTNTTTTALTGNNQVLVRNRSNVRTIANQALAQNSASIVKYVTTIGTKTNETTDLTNRTMNINNIDSNIIQVKAIDSRGFETSVTKTITWINYSPVVLKEYNYKRDNDIDNATTFIINGTYNDVNFGVTQNTITDLKYRYKYTNSDEWSDYITIEPTIDSGSFNFNDYVIGNLGASGFNQNRSFNIEVVVSDMLSSNTESLVLGAGIPGEYLEKYDDGSYGYGIGCRPDGKGFWDNGKSIFDLIYPVGSIYMSVNPTNPSSFFGGTWIAWGGGRVPVGMGSNGTNNYTTVDATGGSDIVKLDIAHIPDHAHRERLPNTYRISASSGSGAYISDGTNPAYPYPGGVYDSNTTTLSAGGGQAHENRQCFITCYMWKRTA